MRVLRSERRIGLAVLVATLAPMATTQAPVRSIGGLHCRYTVGSEHGSLYVEENKKTLRWSVIAEGARDAVLALPFELAADAIHLGNRTFVVSGLHRSGARSFEGILLLVRADPSRHELTILQQERYAGIDPDELCHNATENVLYVYDYQGERLLHLPLDASKPVLPPGKDGLAVAATKDEVPLLRRAASRRLTALDPKGIAVWQRGPRVMNGHNVHFDGAAWVIAAFRQPV